MYGCDIAVARAECVLICQSFRVLYRAVVAWEYRGLRSLVLWLSINSCCNDFMCNASQHFMIVIFYMFATVAGSVRVYHTRVYC